MKKNKLLINDSIRADEVLLIDENGEKQGLINTAEAIKIADSKSLDLVQVSPVDVKPPVCKLLDYGKHIFNKKKGSSNSKQKTRKNSMKEIKFRPSTDIGDYEVKIKKIKSFILSGDKTKISVRFRGREILNSDMGLELLSRVSSDLADISQVDSEPSLEGRQLLMILAPKKANN